MREIVVISGKGGTGKSTVSVLLGAQLGAWSRRVLLIELDSGLRSVDMIAGVYGKTVYDIEDVLCGRCDGSKAIVPSPLYPGLSVISAPYEGGEVRAAPLAGLILAMREYFDYILLDCPAGIEQGFKNAIAGADRAIIVTTPEVSAIRDADRIIGLLEAEELKKIELVINRIRMDMVKRGDMMSVEDVVDILAIDLIGVVPDDESIVIATNEGEPLVGSDTQAGKAFANICHRVLGEEVPIMEFEAESILKKIANLFKRGY